MDARQQACERLQRETGATFIPPYNYGPVISGQGTIALELLQQAGGASRCLRVLPDAAEGLAGPTGA
jgi:threonine dehydratase